MTANGRLRIILALSVLELLAIALPTYCFRGATSPWDSAMHLSKVKILLDSINKYGYFPRWNPYWYFGVPMWRIYSPMSYYIATLLGWILHLSLLDILTLWTYLAFSVIAISTFLLGTEIGLKPFGSFVSSVLLVSSANLIQYWGMGSYPNVTGFGFSILALFLLLKAVSKRTFLSILAAGVAFSLVLLTYLMNVIVLAVFTVIFSVLLVVRQPSLLCISRGSEMPPRYTMILPKVLLSLVLIAVPLSSWWLLPFLATYTSAPSIPEAVAEGVDASKPLFEHFTRVVGIAPSIYSPGVGHIVLASIGSVFALARRRAEVVAIVLSFVTALIFLFAPWLRIPTGPFYWWRFSLYFSLFAALCGGSMIELFTDYYGDLFAEGPLKARNTKSTSRIHVFAVSMLVLLVTIYPVLGSEKTVFEGLELLEVPEYVRFMESRSQLGERVGINGGYAFSLYTDIPQSDGGDVYYMYMANEFAYKFWRDILDESISTYVPYFARCYNVRWFLNTDMPGLKEVYPGVYEVQGFSSSYVELIKPGSKVVLFIGDHNEYVDFFFTSLAMINPDDIISVYGGLTIDGYDLETLANFDVVYLHGLNHNVEENRGEFSALLSMYVDNGGGLILDTGDLSQGRLSDIPQPFPVGETDVFEDSHLDLSQTDSLQVTGDVNLTEFHVDETRSVSYATAVRDGAGIFIYEEGRPLAACYVSGSGRTLWTGLRLPYLAVACGKKVAAELLANMVRFAASTETGKMADLAVNLKPEFPSPDETVVRVKNASIEDAVWVKTSYFPGWVAEMSTTTDEHPLELRIFQAGPNMMLVFPRRDGGYTLRFHFEKTAEVYIGEIISVSTVTAIGAFLLFARARKGKFSFKLFQLGQQT